MTTKPMLQFAPFSSAVESSFWHLLADKKLDIFKLNDTTQLLHGYYATGQTLEGGAHMPARLCLGTGAFKEEGEDISAGIPPFTFPATGTLKNTNTIEDFKKLDKAAFIKDEADKILQNITTGVAIQDPSLLVHFVLLTFADLKKYKFHYLFGFPAFLVEPNWTLEGEMAALGDVWGAEEVESLRTNYDTYRDQNLKTGNAGFFLVKEVNKNIQLAKLSEWKDFFEGVEEDKRIIGFADPSSLPNNPGWPLRNFLHLVYHHFGIRKAKILCFRETPGKKDIGQSRILVAELPSSQPSSADSMQQPKIVGWEKNLQGKLAPQMADLAPMMDPTRLADTAVDLNLKLMRWRIMPSLQLEKIKETRCLLLGAGTLGCYVARCLMGWGVRNITFVDNARVSFSNPVRQPLFFFDDCLAGGKPKAHTAAENLRKVYPGVNSKGYEFSVPMPGHPIAAGTEERVQEEVELLTRLIYGHDVIFLLMDSRESRWLPTLLGAYTGKIVINAALGFESFMVMRHGLRNRGKIATNKETELGCYYCSDVVAPTDSLTDRTLDEQCTVTRPGLSAIASALAVELMVSILHHDKGAAAPAETITSNPSPLAGSLTSTPLGMVPHQIRGFLSNFQNLLLSGHAYDKCTACSDIVLNAYESEGFGFLRKVFDSPTYVEDLTGLLKLREESEDLEDLVWDDDED